MRLQAEEAFADPFWRAALNHAVGVRAADNAPDPCRGLQGYITTYQSVAAAPHLHLAEFQRHRTLLVLDEMHHLPALSDMAPDPLADHAADAAAGWSRALLPLLETARLRLLLSGTLQRADGRSIPWRPYRTGTKAKTREVDLAEPGWAVVGYSRSQALAERAVLPVMFGAVDGEASWLDETKVLVGPHRLFSSWPTETARPALFTALRTGLADQLLREAFNATRSLRAKRRQMRSLELGINARGLGKLLVVAADQHNARRYAETPMPRRGGRITESDLDALLSAHGSGPEVFSFKRMLAGGLHYEHGLDSRGPNEPLSGNSEGIRNPDDLRASLDANTR